MTAKAKKPAAKKSKKSRAAAAPAIKRYAVIDIGSNAVRLNMGVITADGQFISETFTRIPLSLGSNTFSQSKVKHASIPRPAQKRLAQTLAGMQLLIKSMAPVTWQAVATAALRSASNRTEVLQAVRDECGLSIRVLSGAEEAKIIGRFVAAQFPNHHAILNIDVGGGSTDCALISGGDIAAAETFAIGTVRENGGDNNEKQRLQEWLKTHYSGGGKQQSARPLVCGSGGNVRRLVGDAKTKSPTLNLRTLQQWQRQLLSMHPTDIATHYGMPLDHANRLNNTVAIYQLILSITKAPLHPISGGLAEAVLRDLSAKRR